MFAIFCPRHEARVLLSAASILALHTTARGLMIRYRCTCGHEGCSPPFGAERVAA